MEGYHLWEGRGDESNDWLFVNSRAPGTNYESFLDTGGCLSIKHGRFLFTVLLVDTSDTLCLKLCFDLSCFFVHSFLGDSKVGLCWVEKMQAETCHTCGTLVSPVWNKTIPVRQLYLDEPSVALSCWVLRMEKPELWLISCCVLTLL